MLHLILIVCDVGLGSVGVVFCGVGGIDMMVTVNEKSILLNLRQNARIMTKRKSRSFF